MASRILTYFQVIPSYIDFLSVFTVIFGQQVEAVELRFSGFRERVLLSANPARGMQLPDVALSGRNYQLCYNLKCVALKNGRGDRENWQWSPRQGSFHHQFDVAEGTTLWIMTSAREELRNRVNQLTGDEGRTEDRSYKSPADSFISSFAVHLLLAQWATEDWRGYIRWLEQVLEEKVGPTSYKMAVFQTNKVRLYMRFDLAISCRVQRTFHSSKRSKTRRIKPL